MSKRKKRSSTFKHSFHIIEVGPIIVHVMVSINENAREFDARKRFAPRSKNEHIMLHATEDEDDGKHHCQLPPHNHNQQLK